MQPLHFSFFIELRLHDAPITVAFELSVLSLNLLLPLLVCHLCRTLALVLSCTICAVWFFLKLPKRKQLLLPRHVKRTVVPA